MSAPPDQAPPTSSTALWDLFEHPVSVFGVDGRYRYINARGLALLGRTGENLVGSSYLELYPDLADHPYHAAFQRLASGTASTENLEFHDEPSDAWARQRLYRAEDSIVVLSEDITASKHAERSLAETLARAESGERLFRGMIEHMPQLAWTARADGFIDYYNPRWYEFTGTTPEQMEGWGWRSVHDPEFLQSVMERWQFAIAHGERFEMEFPLRRHDGVLRGFLTRVSPVRDGFGNVVRWVGVNTEIHDQKVALEQLDDTLESMSDAFFLLDAEWRILRVNRNQESMSQVPRTLSLGRSFWEVFPSIANDSTQYWREYHRTMRERVPTRFDEYYPPLQLWTEVDAFPSHDGGIAVFFRDVSERKRSEAALAGERGRLAALAEVSAALSESLDFERTVTRIAATVIASFADVFTVRLLSDGPAATAAVYAVDTGVRDSLAALASEAQCGNVWPFDYGQVLTTGTAVAVLDAAAEGKTIAARLPQTAEHVERLSLGSAIVVPLSSHGTTWGALGFATMGARRFSELDVKLAVEIGRRAAFAYDNARLYRDAHAALDSERRARDRAEEATRIKDEFLATLSHELRTPLSAILGWARMLQTGGLDESKTARAMDTIIRNAVAQAHLIDDLLDVSRIATGKLRREVEAVDLRAIVEAAIEVVRPAAVAKRIALAVALDDAAASFAGDAGRLQQIVWNLLTNAIKFTPPGGSVLTALTTTEHGIELCVSDTGAGIDPAFLPYVFHRFRQQDGSITRKTGGLGLGLAIVKSLAELHGGTVTAASDGEGHGARFTVAFPVLPAPLEQISPTALSPDADARNDAPLATRKVLVVDDSFEARELTRAMLEEYGAIVLTAAGGNEALAMIRYERPDVIVSDIGMPGLDGYAFLRAVRALPAESGGETPALALSAYAGKEYAERALHAGYQRHASKPIDPHALRDVLLELLSVAP